MDSTRLIPGEKVNGERFGQLLINALQDAGHLQQFLAPQDPMVERDNRVMEYLVVGKDLFYIENDELEEILQGYLAKDS